MEPTEILVIVPSRGRPQTLAQMAEAWSETDATADLMYVVDDDDPTLDLYEKAFAEIDNPNVILTVGPRLRLAGSLNAAANQWAGSYAAVGFLGDDHRPRTSGWDKRFAQCLSGGAGVVYGNDLLMGSRMPTAVVMTSNIIHTLGYMCPPGLVHLCLDLVWLDWGQGMGRITYLDDVVIEHLHPANGKATLDDGYVEVNSEAMVSADTTAYFTYKENDLAVDLKKLRTLP